MPPPLCLTFPALEVLRGFSHAFTLRHPDIDVAVDREEALRRLQAWHSKVVNAIGFEPSKLATVHQVHGNDVLHVTSTAEPLPDADGLLSDRAGIVLGIHVADCGAVFLVDHVRGAFGVLHSGKKGTEQNITGTAIQRMQEWFGTKPQDLVVQLSPCIRPPAYEVDFAARILTQAHEAGVLRENIHDQGTCTSSDPAQFYSYRREKGRTGRMLALLGRQI